MSGGHFYHYTFNSMIEELEKAIVDESQYYRPETIEKFNIALNQLKIANIMLQRVDYLLSGDDGEDSFHDRWNNDLKEYQ